MEFLHGPLETVNYLRKVLRLKVCRKRPDLTAIIFGTILTQAVWKRVTRGQPRHSPKGAEPQCSRKFWGPPACAHTVWETATKFSSPTRGHSYKLYKAGCSKSVRSLFFANRVINVWNGLPSNTDFSSLTSFEHTIEMIDFSQLLRYE